MAAVIQVVNKEPSPTLRHITTTLKVNLDWLVERISSDQSLGLRHVIKSKQFANLLTEGTFSSQQRSHFLILWQIEIAVHHIAPSTHESQLFSLFFFGSLLICFFFDSWHHQAP